MARIEFTIKAPEEILKKRGLIKYGAVQKLIDREALSRCEGYTPKRSGALIESGTTSTKIGSGKICYSAPYARVQYYGVSKSGKGMKYGGAPLRGAFWFERMKEAHLPSILALAAKEAGASDTRSGSSERAKVPLNQPVKTVLGKRRNPVF